MLNKDTQIGQFMRTKIGHCAVSESYCEHIDNNYDIMYNGTLSLMQTWDDIKDKQHDNGINFKVLEKKDGQSKENYGEALDPEKATTACYIRTVLDKATYVVRRTYVGDIDRGRADYLDHVLIFPRNTTLEDIATLVGGDPNNFDTSLLPFAKSIPENQPITNTYNGSIKLGPLLPTLTAEQIKEHAMRKNGTAQTQNTTSKKAEEETIKPDSGASFTGNQIPLNRMTSAQLRQWRKNLIQNISESNRSQEEKQELYDAANRNYNKLADGARKRRFATDEKEL